MPSNRLACLRQAQSQTVFGSCSGGSRGVSWCHMSKGADCFDLHATRFQHDHVAKFVLRRTAGCQRVKSVQHSCPCAKGQHVRNPGFRRRMATPGEVFPRNFTSAASMSDVSAPARLMPRDFAVFLERRLQLFRLLCVKRQGDGGHPLNIRRGGTSGALLLDRRSVRWTRRPRDIPPDARNSSRRILRDELAWCRRASRAHCGQAYHALEDSALALASRSAGTS